MTSRSSKTRRGAAHVLPERHRGRWDGRTPVGELPARAAARWGDRESLVFGAARQSFAEIARRVDEAAKGLIALGVAPGDKVCLWLNNCPEWVHLLFAIARIGAILVPANTRFRTGDIEYVVRQGDCSTLITHDVSGPVDYLAMVRELVPESGAGCGTAPLRSERFPLLERIVTVSDREHPGAAAYPALVEAGRSVSDADLAARAAAVAVDDTLFIMFTSGTTGFPKGVMRNHHLLRNQCDRMERLAITEADVVLNYLPLFHIFGYVDGPLLSVMAGSRQVLTASFDPDECVGLVETERATQMQGFDSHLKALMDAQERRPRDTSSLRIGFFPSGMASSVPIVRRVREVFPTMQTLTAYGSTEGGANICTSFLDSSEEQRCETSGHPCDGFEIRIADPESGEELPPRAPGEILVRSYNLMQGYYRKPVETAAAIDSEGWLRSGDLGYLREDGYLRFLGRCKDMIKVGGENVDPVEVEQLLLEHPAVCAAAVVAYPDERMTEVAVAFVVPREERDAGPGAGCESESRAERDARRDALAREILELGRGRVASFKLPRHVLFVAELPMTSSGKVRKAELRDLALARLGAAAG
ncbi:MAG: AMP-binding protein [Immundisolibacterales bacterium]|nr:AMP-binding protein [Immundisolibacterales bacterium]